MKFRNVLIIVGLCSASMPLPLGAAEKLELHALFKDKAIIVVDGARRVLKAGDTSPEGVKLIATDTGNETADIEIGGKREQLKLGVVLSSFASTGKGSITLYPDQGGHFLVDGTINDVAVRFLVDTGATSIAMNSGVAARVGIDYKRFGRAGAASTAGGLVRSYYIKLGKVQVGQIVMHNVDAAVIEGGFPQEVLLGMSFLGSLDMRRENDTLELRER